MEYLQVTGTIATGIGLNRMTTQLDLLPVIRLKQPTPFELRYRTLAMLSKRNGQRFTERACAEVLRILQTGPASGEQITDRLKEAGIVPLVGDDRAFGPIYSKLSKEKLIEKCGTCLRRRGHATQGGNIWRLVG